ncbi:hypothetical protein ACSAZK_05840 [Methanosarcina sp. Mfa9]|uniref:hypothetical protein n=1 Tax=Methanosarcina sp. Mfa9 TaxID=3439063 RepID=UPI003F8267DF
MARLNNFTLISKTFLYLLPILGVAGVTIPLILGQSNLSLLGTYLAVPMILAPIIHIKLKGNETSFKTFNPKLFSSFVSIYFIFFFISISLLQVFDVRPFAYYLVIAVMYGLVLLEILMFEVSEKKVPIILLQMVILTVNIIWGVTLNYDFFIGRTDPIGHLKLIESVINAAFVTEIFDVYKPFPLWHILCAFMQNVLGISLSAQKIMFVTNGVIYSFVPVVSYLVSMKIFKDSKIALLSALFVSIYPEVILYGMQSIPRSVVSFLEIMLILVLLDPQNPAKVFAAIILVFSLIAFHTASMPFVLSILFAIYVLEKIYNKENDESLLSFKFIILAICMTLVYWLYYGIILFETLVYNITRSAPSGVLTESVFYTPLSELFNYLQYTPLLLFVIIGFFSTLQSKRASTFGKIFCMIGLFTVAITFPGPTLLFNKLASNFNLARFGEYSFLFIGLTGSIGFYEMYSKSKKYLKIFVVILFISMTFLTVSNDFTASDNPLVKRPFYTYYLTNEEETSFEHIASVTEGYVMADYVTSRYYSFSEYKDKSHIIEVGSTNKKILRDETDDIFLIRESELEKRPLKLYAAPGEEFVSGSTWEGNLVYYYKEGTLWDDLIMYNKIYDSKSVTGFNHGP